MTTSVTVKGATVLDGTGAAGISADVSFTAGEITQVAPAIDAGDRSTVIDARGRVLAPGFIDVHTHDDFAAVLHPTMDFKVRGGVTTCVVGNCGMGAAPWAQASLAAAAFHPGHDLPQWEGYAGYLARLDREPASVNVAALAGHGTIRAAVLHAEDRAPRTSELDRMQELVREGMNAGCVGMSTGLIYEPSRYAATDEIVALAAVLADAGGIYTSHIRGEADTLLRAIDEAIEIGERSGAPVVISHLKAHGVANFGRVNDALTRIDQARTEGITVAADQYPYTAGSTVLSAVVESFARTGLGSDDVVVATCEAHRDWQGRSLRDIAAQPEIAADPNDAVAVARAVIEIEPLATCVIHSMSEGDVRTVLSRPDVMVGSDGIPSLEGHPHPRLYGTFARILGHYARDEHVVDLATAIHKMTGRAAEVFGFHDRGVIRRGAAADLVLFDPDTIADRATYADPHRYPAGIDRVWVGGVEVVRDGAHTGSRPGRTLRR